MTETASEVYGQEASEREAAELGRAHGTNAGSWVVDGNSDNATLKAVIDASAEGTFFDLLGEVSGPLSGEWADGYSLSALSDDTGMDEESDGFSDVCDAYEGAYWQAYEEEAVRSACAMLPDDDA